MNQDLNTLIFKMLKYANDCMKAGIEPSIEEMRKFANGNDVMFMVAIMQCKDNELLSGLYIPSYIDASSATVFGRHTAITLKGHEFLEDNSSMKKVASKISQSALSVISVAVQSTIKNSMGL